MKHRKMLSVSLVLMLALMATVKAETKVIWHEPENYSDVEETTGNAKKFQKSVFSRLEKHLIELSKDLTKGQNLTIKVLDLDLAGRVYHGYSSGFNTPRDVRLVERIHFPKMKLSYSLTDKAGNEIKSGEASLKDINFLDRLQRVSARRDGLSHEKRMLEQWLKKLSKEL